MVNGIYTRLAEVHNDKYFAVLGRSDDVNAFVDLCGNFGTTLDYPEFTANIYLNLYTAIININRLTTVVSQNDEKALLGEIYFLRSYCYFKLARLFGTPPIILDTEVNYQVEKSSYEEIYNRIEEDMLNALDLLPETYAESRVPGETPNKGTAKAMLAEIYLNMAGYPLHMSEKYAEAAHLAKEVIEQSDAYNYHLLNDFADLWREDNTHNNENIFGLFFNAESNNSKNCIIPISGGSSEDGSAWVSSSYYHPNCSFYINFPDNYRRYNSFVTGIYKPVDFESIDTLASSIYFKPFDPTEDICPYSKKAGCLKWIYGSYDFYDTGVKEEKSSSTIYLLRYAQVLLTYAEAKARSGKPDQLAYEGVNQIRRRANNLDLNSPSEFDLPTTLTTDQFIDSVVWERAWELTMEPDTRWFDIIRLDLKEELEASFLPGDHHNEVPAELLTDDWYFYKIPQEDRWNNPNLE